MKSLIGLAAAVLAAFAAAGSTSAASGPDGRWGGVQPDPRHFAQPHPPRWGVAPHPPRFGKGRPKASLHGAIGRY